MYPFHVLPKTALPADAPYAFDFGELSVDTVPIVLRSIPESDGACLLNLALVNKTAYFATKTQRLVLFLRSGARQLERETVIGEALRQFFSVLAMASMSNSENEQVAAAVMLADWLDRLASGDGQSGDLPDKSMLPMVLDAIGHLPMPWKEELLWKMLAAYLECHALGEKSPLLKAMAAHAKLLKTGTGRQFMRACSSLQTARSGKGSEADILARRKAVFADLVAAQEPWPATIRERLLCKLLAAFGRTSRGWEGNEDADHALAMIASLPLPLRLKCFDALCFNEGTAFALAVSGQLHLDHSLKEWSRLPDEQQVSAFLKLVDLLRYLMKPGRLDGAALPALEKMVENAQDRLLDAAMISVQHPSFARNDGGMLRRLLVMLYGDENSPRTDLVKLRAVCEANRRLHGTSYGCRYTSEYRGFILLLPRHRPEDAKALLATAYFLSAPEKKIWETILLYGSDEHNRECIYLDNMEDKEQRASTLDLAATLPAPLGAEFARLALKHNDEDGAILETVLARADEAPLAQLKELLQVLMRRWNRIPFERILKLAERLERYPRDQAAVLLELLQHLTRDSNRSLGSEGSDLSDSQRSSLENRLVAMLEAIPRTACLPELFGILTTKGFRTLKFEYQCVLLRLFATFPGEQHAALLFATAAHLVIRYGIHTQKVAREILRCANQLELPDQDQKAAWQVAIQTICIPILKLVPRRKGRGRGESVEELAESKESEAATAATQDAAFMMQYASLPELHRESVRQLCSEIQKRIG
jgi:hypothetical protein